MKQMAFILLILTSSPFLFAQAFQPVSVPLGVIEKVVVRGFKGKLEIIPSSSDELHVEGRKNGGGRFDQWKFQVRKKQNTMEVLVKGPSETEDWEKLRSKSELPSFDLKVRVPKRSLEIFWGEGSVVVKRWVSPISLQMTEGDVSFEKGEGPLMAQLIKGRLKITEHQGNIGLQTFNGQVFLENTKGSLNVNNHSSSYQIKDHQGPSDFRNHSGTVVYKAIKGNMSLKNVSGVISLTELDGSFEGEFDKGAINVEALKLQNFVVNTNSAPITLKFPKDSGARVKLRSEKGRLRAPSHLRKIRKGRWTELRGQLRGGEQGQIKIVSKYGDIMLK